MSDIEKIEQYIDRTHMKRKELYPLRLGEIMALYEAGGSEIVRMIALAYDYGMARGYRMAKKEAKA